MLLVVLSGLAAAQTNEITGVMPASAAQGTTGLTVTFTLDTDLPRAPAATVMPSSVMIGSVAGTVLAHPSQFSVTAMFAIPPGESLGTKDVSVVFPLPGGGTLTFSASGAFTVTAAVSTPPTVTQQPLPRSVPLGATARFAVGTAGSAPLACQWQKNGSNITSATAASLTLGAAQASDAGTYRCVVSNSYGATTSTAVRLAVDEDRTAWRFAVVSDTHVTTDSTILSEIVAAMSADGAETALFCGDNAEAGLGTSTAELQAQLSSFRDAVAPLRSAGIGVYAVRGNHEDDAADDITAWNNVFAGAWAMPANGPAGETNLTYSFTLHNAMFVGLDNYATLHQINQAWLDQTLAANTRPHVFVFGHEPAFQVFHTDCLGTCPVQRNTFWASLAAAHAKLYFCGHDHFFDLARIGDGDGNATNDLLQCAAGTGGSSHFMTSPGYRGTNAPYTPVAMCHDDPYGYVLVEVSGTASADRGVTLTWKQRTYDPGTGSYRYAATSHGTSYTADTTATVPAYPVVDTGQVKCYDANSEIAVPAMGQPFYGQDGQTAGRQPSYTPSGDGLTVHDNRTGLTWQRTPDTNADGVINYSDKMALSDAQARPAALNAAHYGGFGDWRLPTIKELYSLIDFRGIDPGNATGTTGLAPFIDTAYFQFAYGDTAAGERIIDAQYASSTLYAGTLGPGETAKLFGVNFADGRIKGYGITASNPKRFLVLCVRGNTAYGTNDFHDNGNLTVSDRATGLMWAKCDSGAPMTWQAALQWAQDMNAAGYLGHRDWRVPNAKEIQSILDYTRCPDTLGTAAIDPVFGCTAIAGEPGTEDFPWYWTGTTHVNFNVAGKAAVYVCFGRAWGYMNSNWVDVHGAGAQRSDAKSGSLSGYSYAPYGHYSSLAPQGDAVRLSNYVRLVRDDTSACGASGWEMYR